MFFKNQFLKDSFLHEEAAVKFYLVKNKQTNKYLPTNPNK